MDERRWALTEHPNGLVTLSGPADNSTGYSAICVNPVWDVSNDLKQKEEWRTATINLLTQLVNTANLALTQSDSPFIVEGDQGAKTQGK